MFQRVEKINFTEFVLYIIKKCTYNNTLIFQRVTHVLCVFLQLDFISAKGLFLIFIFENNENKKDLLIHSKGIIKYFFK